MKVLITGGSGFIGTNLLESCLGLNFEVLNVDIVSPRNQDHLNYYVHADIRDFIAFSKIVQDFQPSVILHMAARTDLNGKTIEDYSSNVLGVENLCKIACSYSFINKVIFSSSMLVCRAGYVPISDSDYCPTTKYGESKVLGERIVEQYSAKLPNFTIVRPTSIWGPWFSTPYKDFFDMVLAGNFFSLGSRSCNKSYGYVGNSVNQILSILEGTPLNSQRVYYLGDSPSINISTWADLIATKAGVRKPLKLPYFIFKCAAIVGDSFGFFKLKFPFSSFRLMNMTTDNVFFDLPVIKINKYDVIGIDEGVSKTLSFIKKTSNF